MNRYSFGMFLFTLLGGLATFDAGAVTESTQLSANDEPTTVALEGDTMVLGAPYAAVSNAQQVGRAFVSLREGNTWTSPAELIPNPDDRAAFDEFGSSVAISGDTALVGARRHNDDHGAAYVFVRSGATWTQQAKLTASLGASGDGFGAAVALSGDTAVIGAGGANASYVFTRSSNAWVPPGPPFGGTLTGAPGSGFGCAVAVSGDSALIGAPGADNNAGAAYAFKSSGGNWSTITETTLLTPIGNSPNDYLGYAVDLSGRYALIGAPGADSNAGAAYVFYYTGSSIWRHDGKIASGTSAGDGLGRTVNLGGEQADVALLGAPGALATKGAAYLFTRGSGGNAATWTASASNPLSASNGASSDRLGTGVALFGDAAVAVAPTAVAAYVYRFDCGFGRYWPAGVWLFPGLPCAPDVATVSGQFSDDLGGDTKYGYSNRWYLYDWNETTQSLVGLTVTSPVVQGGGYELKTLDGGRVGFTGAITGSNPPLVPCHYVAGCFEIALPLSNGTASKVALVGHPFPYPVDWADVRFTYSNYNGGQLLTPSAAHTLNIANKSFRRYNGNANETYDDSTPGMNGNLWPNESVWVWVKTSATSGTIKLLIPAKPSRQNAVVQPAVPTRFALIERLLDWLIPTAEAASRDDPGAAARDARRQQHRDAIARGEEWYVQLIVETADGQFADPANVLGQLTDTSTSYDAYDVNELEESPPLPDGPVLYLTFPHPDWKQSAGDYSSDYHPLSKNQGDRWTFEVRGNQKGTLRLRWKASSPEAIARGQLVDQQTGVVIAAAVDHYEFALNGPTRTFRWEYLASNGKPPK
jgi:hypothetical protein